MRLEQNTNRSGLLNLGTQQPKSKELMELPPGWASYNAYIGDLSLQGIAVPAELQDGCLPLAHSNLFTPSNLNGSCLDPYVNNNTDLY